MIKDYEQILTIVMETDPSFREIDQDELDRHVRSLRQHAIGGHADDFLLRAMRLLALPNNGHSRLIPNQAISVFPLRFVSIGTAVRLLDTAPDIDVPLGGELISINGIPLADIAHETLKFLAGTKQRKRVIGPILFAWPGAMRYLGVLVGDDPIAYQFRDDDGSTFELRLDANTLVRGESLYPTNEHGRTYALWSPTEFLDVKALGTGGLVLSLPSFFDATQFALPKAISEASAAVCSSPSATIFLDVRGNTGGDFLKTLPLIDALSNGPDKRKVFALVDKFTFSAAIVFVAILRYRLGNRLTIIGEEMGDGLKFFAEGGSRQLVSSGAVVRYSTALHDWAEGTSDHTTAAEITEQIRPVGRLDIDQYWVSELDNEAGRDRLCSEILNKLEP